MEHLDLVAVAARITVPTAGALTAHHPPCPGTWANLTCDLPAGHRSIEHYDRTRRELWLHPDDLPAALAEHAARTRPLGTPQETPVAENVVATADTRALLARLTLLVADGRADDAADLLELHLATSWEDGHAQGRNEGYSEGRRDMETGAR